MPRFLSATLSLALLTPVLSSTGPWIPTSDFRSRSSDPDPKAIDAVFAAYDHTNTPGCALGVFRDERIIYARGYGMADLNQGLAITPRTVFYLASMSKQFTAAAIALLAEQGKLSLEDPIRKYVPELPAYADPITINQLVHHTSGIRDYLGLWQMSGRSIADEIPEEQALDFLVRQKALDFPPGTKWSYSNSGYLLLTIIVKRASGQSLREFTTANMFAPLGMTNTHFHDDNTMIVPNRAEGYQPSAKGGFEIVRTSFALVGDGGLYSTIEDLFRWDSNFYHNKLGSRGQALVDQVYTPGTLSNGSPLTYGFGLMPGKYRGLPVIEHGGSFIGYRTQLMRFPKERFSVAVLCNDYTVNPDGLARKVADLYLADRLEPVAAAPAAGAGVSVPAAKLDQLVGRYEVMTGFIFDIARRGDGLTFQQIGGGFPSALRSVSDTVFESGVFPGQFIFHTTPAGPGLNVTVFGTDVAPRMATAPTLGPADFAAYNGRYTSDELDTWMVIEVRDGKLMARSRYGRWMPLTVVRRDAFLVGQGIAVFERDKQAHVTGFKYSAARTQNLRFVRAAM
ncbi:MAG: serine hydrolase [Gemmatimonadota bacterium]